MFVRKLMEVENDRCTPFSANASGYFHRYPRFEVLDIASPCALACASGSSGGVIVSQRRMKSVSVCNLLPAVSIKL